MKQYGILGYPAKHSLSPAVQNAAFKALSVDAQYGVFEVPMAELADFIGEVKGGLADGLSVTAPYKEVVMEYLSEVAGDARAIGAVNTVVNNGGVLSGYNTDYIGMNKALVEVVGSLKGRRAVVLGAGGAARAAVYGLKAEGAEVGVYNRTASKALALAEEFGVEGGGLDDVRGGDILLQTTSIWMDDVDAGVEDLISEEVLREFEVVMDIVYKPLITPLIETARRLGLRTITGERMFLHQAIVQFELWTGQRAPMEVMEKVLADNLS